MLAQDPEYMLIFALETDGVADGKGDATTLKSGRFSRVEGKRRCPESLSFPLDKPVFFH
ncbi:MAG: hypothetical protein LBF77_03435 [Spirochaetaceae bacterium]|jgi:hypothetical protein|nr:hypothetical protein [Spirochaetaceae bacterium]